MSNFCNQCGRRLMDGEVCSCKTVKQNPPPMPQQQQPMYQSPPPSYQQSPPPIRHSSPNSSGFFANLFGFIVELIKKPADSIKSIMNRQDTGLAWGLLGVNVIAICLSMFIFINNIPNIFGPYAGFARYVGRDLVPYVKIFFFTAVVFVSLLVLLAATLLMFIRFKNKNYNFTSALSVATASFIPYTISMIASSILMFLFEPIGMLVLALGGLVSGVILFMSYKYAYNDNDNKLIYTFALFSIAYCIFSFIVLYAIGRVILSSLM